ncbi:MAG: hypothetical protein CR991_04330 [Proteobacteria bacterium]|nr:MAG: hypothetical protein CR991_04330 [Pseudomonadota bacterium]
MKASTEILQLLSEIGYMACFKGDSTRSQIIMEGVDAIASEQSSVKMGVAVAKMYAGDMDGAIDIFRNNVLAKEPNHMSAKCFLGIALTLKGEQEEAKALFEEVSKHGNPDEKGIADFYLSQ